MADNMERLRDEDFIINTPMPEQYEAVLQGLSDQEMETLISVKRRFDEAQIALGRDKQDYVNYFLPF
jgi:hypothetical protein